MDLSTFSWLVAVISLFLIILLITFKWLIKEIREPWVRIEVLTPSQYMGDIMKLCQLRRGQYVNTKYLTHSRSDMQMRDQYIILEYDIPLKRNN